MSTWQTVVIAVAIIQICLGTTTIYAKENAVCTAETNKVIESKIGYIRKDIPSFTIPPYKGQYYQDMVPYTLDLAEMATLTINDLGHFWVDGVTQFGNLMDQQLTFQKLL
ncbi:MAG: hypothetical protein ACYC54_07325 [Sedimentisphaerales bacterium]